MMVGEEELGEGTKKEGKNGGSSWEPKRGGGN